MNKLIKINNIFYKNDIYYLYIMTLYHILIIFYIYYLNYKPIGIWYNFEPLKINVISEITLKTGFISLMWSIVILSLDLIFILILRVKLSLKWLKNYHIILIEIIILFFSLSHPLIREILLFLSVNTIQIFIAFYLMNKIPFNVGKYLFISLGYILLIKILLYPFIEIIKIIIAFS